MPVVGMLDEAGAGEAVGGCAVSAPSRRAGVLATAAGGGRNTNLVVHAPRGRYIPPGYVGHAMAWEGGRWFPPHHAMSCCRSGVFVPMLVIDRWQRR